MTRLESVRASLSPLRMVSHVGVCTAWPISILSLAYESGLEKIIAFIPQILQGIQFQSSLACFFRHMRRIEFFRTLCFLYKWTFSNSWIAFIVFRSRGTKILIIFIIILFSNLNSPINKNILSQGLIWTLACLINSDHVISL